MKKDNNRLLAKEWFDKAKEDILYARDFYQRFMGKHIHKIHLIRSLIHQCIKIDKDFDKFKEYCNRLDTYYISPRYPVIHTVYSKEQADEAVNMAEEIIKFIEIKTGDIK